MVFLQWKFPVTKKAAEQSKVETIRPGLLTLYFKFTHTLLQVYPSFPSDFTHRLFWVTSHFTLGLLSFSLGAPTSYSVCSHTFIQVFFSLLTPGLLSLLWVHSHPTPILHTLYSLCAHTLLSMVLAIFTGFTHTFLWVLHTVYSSSTHTFLHVFLCVLLTLFPGTPKVEMSTP